MNRTFIVDPVCAITFGHSLNALSYFAEMARRYSENVIKVASRHLPTDGPDGDDIERFFEFQYDNFIEIERKPAPQDWAGQGTRVLMNAEASATVDFSRFMMQYAVTSGDSLLFPSVDFYSLLGVLNVVEALPAARQPKLMLRLIGVMETAALDMSPTMASNHFRRRLREAMDAGVRITVCAETPKYARELTKALGVKVPTVPYIAPDIDPLPIPQDGPITFLSGGSAREDKGFFRLKNIITLAHQRTDLSKVQFKIQGLPKALYSQHAGYMAWLHTLPNAEILPGNVPYSEIKRSFAESHVSIMPYDKGTYTSRGSAMLMESMLFNRLTVCQGGTGFAEQCMIYNSGLVCHSDEDFADAIAMYAEFSVSRIEDQASTARKLYQDDIKTSCEVWMKGDSQ